jgi:hypothetical protein
VWGEQVGIVSPSIIEHPDIGPYFRRLARMRHALTDFLARGEMLHPPEVKGDIPEVTSDWRWNGKCPVTVSALQSGVWQAPDARVATVFVNTSLESLAFTWVPGHTGMSAVMTERGATPGPDLEEGKPLRVDLGPGEAQAYIVGP